jgi:hypothetical protein
VLATPNADFHSFTHSLNLLWLVARSCTMTTSSGRYPDLCHASRITSSPWKTNGPDFEICPLTLSTHDYFCILHSAPFDKVWIPVRSILLSMYTVHRPTTIAKERFKTGTEETLAWRRLVVDQQYRDKGILSV